MGIRCDGTRHGFSLRCNGSLYRCAHCGATGCMQNKPGICSQQGFEVNAKCVQCGTIGRHELLGSEQVGFFRTLMHDPN